MNGESAEVMECKQGNMKLLIQISLVLAMIGVTGCMSQKPSQDMQTEAGRSGAANWLERQFADLHRCTPSSLYFDPETKASNDRFLERIGYQAKLVNDTFAKFDIADDFYGVRAVQLAIPSGTNSIYEIRVNANASRLADAIQKRTGTRLDIYRSTFKATSAVAYIIPDGDDGARFVCATFVGE